jgi:phytoene synthase
VSRDTNFYYSFLVLPADKRRAIVAVWDFCRAVDDSVDAPDGTTSGSAGSTDVESLAAEVGRWRREVACCYGASEPSTGQGQRLKPHIARFDLPRKPFDDLVDGVEMDIGDRRYETFDDLYEYCLRVASAVGLICIEIFGYRDPRSRDYAVALGVALQLTNIIRDVPVDLANGRVYLPLEDLARFGCTDADLTAGLSPKVRELLKYECSRARHYYDEARSALPAGEATRLVAAEIMGAIYTAILDDIERRDYDVFSEVVRVPRSRRALIAGSVWVRTMLRGLVRPSAASVEP